MSKIQSLSPCIDCTMADDLSQIDVKQDVSEEEICSDPKVTPDPTDEGAVPARIKITRLRFYLIIAV